jgi:hypothetical protein
VCYLLAGSFCGFLIRKFGWRTCKRFYCGQWGDLRFDSRFSEHFGMTLEEAEGLWRRELLDQAYDPPPVTDEWWVVRFWTPEGSITDPNRR